MLWKYHLQFYIIVNLRSKHLKISCACCFGYLISVNGSQPVISTVSAFFCHITKEKVFHEMSSNIFTFHNITFGSDFTDCFNHLLVILISQDFLFKRIFNNYHFQLCQNINSIISNYYVVEMITVFMTRFNERLFVFT